MIVLESQEEPASQKKRGKKVRSSKMAARLDGSSSSVDLSLVLDPAESEG